MHLLAVPEQAVQGATQGAQDTPLKKVPVGHAARHWLPLRMRDPVHDWQELGAPEQVAHDVLQAIHRLLENA